MKEPGWLKSSTLFLVSILLPVSAFAWEQNESFLHAREAQKKIPAAPPSLPAEQQKKTIGPPQVLEIPLREPPSVNSAPSWQDKSKEHSRQDEPPAVLSRSVHSTPHGYLGVRYATAEDGRAGVRVLDVEPGSPADRAGFSATGPVPRETEAVLNNTIFLLVLTPAFPLGILMSVTHEMYHRGRHDREDLIVAVEKHPVKDAQEFNAHIHRFGPGDTVTFWVRRGNTYVRLTAQLKAEPQ
jgi:hypothetical protein